MLLREIEVFRAVITSGSASKAARLLGVSQPAISQSLRRLEEHAGMPLFQRVRGKLHPTQEAEALLAEVNRCFVGLDAIEHRLRSLRQFGAGRLRIASLPGLGVGFLPRVLGGLDLQKRKVTVSLQIMASREVRARLLAGEADIGLMADEVSLLGLEHSEFARYNGVVALPPGHPLARRKLITPQDLARYPFLSLNPEDGASAQLDGIFQAHGVTPSTVVETPFSLSLCELVRHGVGVAVVNPVTALDYLDHGVVLRRFSEKLEYGCILAMPAGKPLGSFAQELLGIMRARLHADLQGLEAVLDRRLAQDS
ncbi:LysR substrate-binding domain-containing protein [Massilia sp. erpn]|uniref:LysR substrate-binding domain-containing protein n=1 Tax=Massilia sp. erpn TaxID=2738142 RepID=UPI0021023711|nr:LysR substrate-binding domain-containing protein [Massilia sp. erpn]UTY59601.1 LysR family transcriptional regulator [Massilia sp. erpn]